MSANRLPLRCLLFAFALPAIGFAQDTVTQTGYSGELTGKNLRIDQQLRGEATTQNQGQQIVLPGKDGAPDTILNVTDLMPGATRAERERLEALHGRSEDELIKAAKEEEAKVEAEQSARGAAYRTMRESAVKEPADLSDPELRRVAEQVAAHETIEGLEDAFPDCTTEKTLMQHGSKTVVATQDHGCQRLATPPVCTHTRNVDMQSTSGTYVSEESVQSDVSYAINVRDYLPGFVGGAVVSSLSWSGTVEDVRISQEPTVENAYALEITITYDTSVCDPTSSPNCPVQTASVEIALEAGVVAGGEIASAPPDCLEGDDGFCAARWTCLESGPRTVNGVLIDESAAPFLPRLYEGEPDTQLCWLAQANYTCTYPIGEVCGEGAGSGGTLCQAVTEESIRANSCALMELDSSCEKVKSGCAANAVGPGQFCYVEVDSYRCNHPVEAPIIREQLEFECDTPIRCMGSDCLRLDDVQPTTGPRLEHQERLALMQHALADVDPACTEEPCNHFIGEFLTCHRATGGTLSFCAEDATVTDMQLYLRWYDIQTQRAGAIAVEDADDGPEHGSWVALTDQGNWNRRTLQGQNFTSVQEGVRSNGASPRRAPTENPTTREEFEDALGQAPELINLPLIYGRYLERIELPESDWDGSATEFELARKRGLHQCIHVGDFCQAGSGHACPSVVESYCCFASALSKAVHEHLQTDFGDPRSPTCAQGTREPLRAILSDETFRANEWTAMQTLAGLQPNVANADTLVSEEKLTGSGSGIRLSDQERDALTERTTGILASLDKAGIHAAIEAEIRSELPDAVREPAGPGTVSFTPAVYFGGHKDTLIVVVSRIGSQGSVAANVRVAAPPGVASVVSPMSATVEWGNGESGTRRIVLDVDRLGVTASPVEYRMYLESTTGGLALGVSPEATLVIRSR